MLTSSVTSEEPCVTKKCDEKTYGVLCDVNVPNAVCLTHFYCPRGARATDFRVTFFCVLFGVARGGVCLATGGKPRLRCD